MRLRASDPEGWTENRPSAGRRALRIDELWQYRELIGFLAQRDIKVRYKQAAFGGLWAIVQPLASAAIFTVVFGRLADLPSDGVPYLLFAFAGSVLWSYFSASVQAARGSLVTNASLITKVYFPRLAAPVAAVVPGLVDLAVSLVPLAALIAWRGEAPGLAVLLAPLFVVGAVLVAFGTGTLFAALTVQYRDVHHVFGVLLQLWLFATPVAYSSRAVEGGWRWLYGANPMVGVIDGWRWSVLGAPAPDAPALVGAVTGILLIVAGVRVFQRSERRFADVI